MAPIGIAILGSGIFVETEHLPAVLACEKLSLKAVFARSKASVEKLLGDNPHKASIYSTDSEPLSSLLSRDDISAVIIALPITVQPEIIKQCLAAGKHVLSEKPIAPDLASARDLLAWKPREAPAQTLWGVAENFRFLPAYAHAAKELGKLGRLLTFSITISSLIDPEKNNYYKTPWRTVPEYQGGFILDGGVHFTAGLNLLLGETEKVRSVAAYSTLNMEYLPPVDTVSAVVKTGKGVVGNLRISFGSSERKFEYVFAAEKGVVTVYGGGKVGVKLGVGTEQKEETVESFDEKGVEHEVRAFAEAVEKGVLDERQAPELALADLELVEKMLKSGEQEGKSMHITGGMVD